MVRKATNFMIDLMDSGVVDPKQVAENLLGYMSEAEVQDFAEREYDYDEDSNY